MVAAGEGRDMADPSSAIIGKIGVEVYKAIGPKTLLWAKTQVMGKTVLFVGPTRAGKTSLLAFIRGGAYTDPELFIDRTQKVKRSPSLQISSRNRQIRIDVKGIVDTRGTDDPRVQARLLVRYRPHALCILLDANMGWADPAGADDDHFNRPWLKGFLEELAAIRSEEEPATRRLKSFCLFVNKADLVLDAELKIMLKDVKSLLPETLTGSAARLAQMANVLPLSLVEDHAEGKLPVRALEAVFDPFIRE
jgi:hypothetical protein